MAFSLWQLKTLMDEPDERWKTIEKSLKKRLPDEAKNTLDNVMKMISNTPGGEKVGELFDLVEANERRGNYATANQNMQQIKQYMEMLKVGAMEGGLAAMAGGTPLGLGMGLGPKKQLRKRLEGEDIPVREWKWKVDPSGMKDGPDADGFYRAKIFGPNKEEYTMEFRPGREIEVSVVAPTKGGSMRETTGDLWTKFREAVGKDGIVDVMAQFKTLFPEAEEMWGYRATGTKAGQKQVLKMPLSLEEAGEWQRYNMVKNAPEDIKQGIPKDISRQAVQMNNRQFETHLQKITDDYWRRLQSLIQQPGI